MTSTPPTRPTVLQRAGLVLFGAVLALLLSEAALQLLRAGNLMRSEAERRDLVGRRVVYAIGDSHTWGWNVHSHTESMPVRLEARLNQGDPGGPFVVENLGFPGFSTAQALGRLQEACARHPPDLVIVLAGFNDAWNPGPRREERDFFVLPRLLRLWLLADSDDPVHDPTEVVLIDGEPHHRNPDGDLVPVRGAGAREDLRAGDAHREHVERGLQEIVAFCREQGVRVVVQTYASAQNERFRVASEAARAVAEREGLRLVDHARWFAEQRVDPERAFQPDGHPTADGCDRMAAALHEDLEAWPALDDWLEYEPPAVAKPGEPAKLQLGVARLDPEGFFAFELSGTPRAAWQLVLSRSRHDPAIDGAHQVDPRLLLRADSLFFESPAATYGMQGILDADGHGQARVYPELLGLASGVHHAQAVLLRPYPTGEMAEDLRAESAVVSFELE